MPTAKRETLARLAYERLRKKLARGEIPPGSRLVNRTLAKELGISFTPVREAINQLASEGLVDYVRGGGAFVRAVDCDDVEALYDVRELVEPYAAAEAAKHITPEQLEELRVVCNEWLGMAREIRDADPQTANHEQALRWAACEERFHKIVVRAARNRWLAKIARDTLLASQAFAPVCAAPELLTVVAATKTWKDHVSLLSIFRARDAEAAHAWMIEHLRIGRRHVLGHLRRHAAAESPAASSTPEPSSSEATPLEEGAIEN